MYIGLALTPVTPQQSSQAAPLDWDFTTFTAATLPPAITYSRTGMAWRYDTSGVLTTAAHNLVTNSQDFENSAWTKTACTVTGNVIAEPLGGTITGDLITGSSTTVHVSQNVTVASGAKVAVAVYAKAGGGGNVWMRLRIGGGAEVASTWFNLSTGALGASPTPSANILISGQTATDAGNGWYRVSAVFTTTGFTTLNIGAGPATADGGASTTGNTVYLWGMQCEVHTTARSYLTTSVKNMLGYSEAFDNAAWTKTFLTVSANAATDPFGTVYADKLIPAAASNNQFLVQTISYVANASYTQSVYAKAAGYSWLRMSFPNPPMASGRQATFDLSLGTVTGADVGVTTSITDVGGGWYRCAMTATATTTASGTTGLTVNGANTAAVAAIAGDGTSGILVYGAMVGSSGSLDIYLPNVAAAPTSAAFYGARFDHDPVTLEAKGLLIEEARTNYAPGTLNSATYWTALATTVTTGITSPTGQADAYTVTENAGGTTSYGLNMASGFIPTITAGPATASLIVKAGTVPWLRFILCDATTPTIGAQCWFQPSTGTLGTVSSQAGSPTSISATVQTLASGWYRLCLTATLGASTTATMLIRFVSANGATTDAGSNTLLVFNPQLEVGGFATSPILTTTAAVTRAIDLASVTILGNWYNASAGTLYAEASTALVNTSSTALALHDGTGSNLISLRFRNSSPFVSASLTTGGVAQITTAGSASYTAGAAVKMALAYLTDDIVTYFSGATGLTDTLATLPAVTTLQLGARNGGAEPLNGYIRRIKVCDRKLVPATLQSLTS